jgi:hypothetical protein
MDFSTLFVSGEKTLFLVIKIGIFLFLTIYAVFAATIVKQVKIMIETLSTGFETQIKIAVYLHFLLALLILLMAVFLL